VDTLYERDYVARVPGGRALHSTDLGRIVCDFLVKHFPTLFEVGFTARMEDQLDDIANGEAQWPAVMAAMWAPLSSLLAQAETTVAAGPKIRVASAPPEPSSSAAPGHGARGSRKAAAKGRRRGGRRAASKAASGKPAVATGDPCPQCGRPLVQRTGKFGPFVGCSGFPECRYVQRGQSKSGSQPAPAPSDRT
jgi:DNA topoisomerase-1